MKILFVIENYPPHMGGAEVVFKNYAERLAKKHSVTVLTHRVAGTPAFEVMNGVQVLRIGWNRHLFTFLAPLKGLFASFDVIHTTTYNGAPAAWLLGLLKRKPVVITVHETWLGNWKKYTSLPLWKTWAYELLERPIWWLRYSTYLPVSESTASQLRGVLPARLHNRITVLHNRFDEKQWSLVTKQQGEKKRKELGCKKDDFLVFSYGRPGPSKGFEYFVDACKELVKFAKVVMILPENKHTKKKREELIQKLPSKVTVLGNTPYTNLPAYVKAADCVVIPSLCEGFGYAVVEVNAVGTPLVATKAGSIPEVISGEHVLIKPRSAPAIIEGVKMVKKKQYRATKKKSWPWQVKKLEKIYEELV